ncbi:hypothetical protein A2U13_08855 [Fusobacterium necrophorum subsp. funduliforme]|uniref:hypothetical protein n=1 Tax=Fusobacterium necrophorum TaxID=859 RepID=UPI000786E1C8|nr:hypothetical protein [Fusobacterium necrophorum]KYM67125.1 hypothetical protein A2U13_08855 [Fusobacterium necrophorum subsp. funduliforme]
MEKEKVLEIEFIPVWDKWVWKITKQNENVLKRNMFKDDGIGVFSCLSPQFKSEDNRLFIRGSNKNLDDKVESCTDKEKTIIEEKVKAINEKYGKQKRWRAEYAKGYFYIRSFGEIYVEVETRDMKDNKHYECGNYFQTHEQAEKALEKVKKAYQEVWEHE